MGRTYSEIAPLLRGVLLESYIIFYRVLDDRVEIVRVVSGYRDLGTLFPEPEDE